MSATSYMQATTLLENMPQPIVPSEEEINLAISRLHALEAIESLCEWEDLFPSEGAEPYRILWKNLKRKQVEYQQKYGNLPF